LSRKLISQRASQERDGDRVQRLESEHKRPGFVVCLTSPLITISQRQHALPFCCIHFTNIFMHVIPQLRRPLNIRTISVATKLAVRSCLSLIYTFNLPYDLNANVVHSRHLRATPRLLQRFLPIDRPPTSKNGNAPRVSPQAYLTLALHRPLECR
jgi:hypothetical protein